MQVVRRAVELESLFVVMRSAFICPPEFLPSDAIGACIEFAAAGACLVVPDMSGRGAPPAVCRDRDGSGMFASRFGLVVLSANCLLAASR